MEAGLTASLLESFFAQTDTAAQRALLLDYDGTLAPFRVERDRAVPYAGVSAAIGAILASGCTRVVIISGRAVADLERLLDITPLPEIWGSHGWERRLPDGSYFPPRLPPDAVVGLEQAALVAAELLSDQLIERKPAGVAVHWRGLASRPVAAFSSTITRLWTPIAEQHRLTLHPFDGGLELRVPGRDKGTAVRTLIHELHPAAMLAYLGDDLTDEDAFLAIGERGLRVLVRGELRPTAADLWLRPPDELLAFLRRWAQTQ